MLGFEAQQRIQEALRRVDQAMAAEMDSEDVIQKQAQSLRDMIFGAFQYIERESLQLKALLVQIRRLEANQLHVQVKGRAGCILALDPELAYDRRSQAAEGQTQPLVELAARMFVVLAPPGQGLLRYYTIYGDGAWKRAHFTLGAGGIQAQSVLLPRFSPDMLVLEAVDLLGHVCTLHPTWANPALESEGFTTETLRERGKLKIHPTGLGSPRPPR